MLVNIVDSIMGRGKTSWAIQMINEQPDRAFIFITPYLAEVQRIKTACPAAKFCEPLQLGEGKLASFHELLSQGRNIVSTHVLFSMATEETRQLIEAQNYTLILDEALQVLEDIPLKKHDLKHVLDNLAHINEDGFLVWDDLSYDGRLNDIKHMALNSKMFVTGAELIKTFPVELFQCFKEIFILTYMFGCQLQRYYFDLLKVPYRYWQVRNIEGRYDLVPHEFKPDDTSRIKINICQNEKLNAIGEKEFALSKNWCKNNKYTAIKVLKNNVYNYFHNLLKSPSNNNLWTTFKVYKNNLKGRGYASGFLPANTRATNEYKDRTAVAYLANRYVRPSIRQFFSKYEIKVDEDQYALSELLQFIFRSAVREGKEINLYLPSRRMRTLLETWLEHGGC